MFKKSLAQISAAIIMVAGISAAGTVAANATNSPITQLAINVTGHPISGMPTTAMQINSGTATQWTMSAVTWNPSPAGGSFSSNTIYVATVTLTASASYEFANLSANAISASGAGASYATVTSPAVPTSASTLAVTVTFTSSGSGGGGGGGSSCSHFSPTSTATASNITDTSMTVDFATLANDCPSVTTWTVKVRTVSPLAVVATYNVLGSTHSVNITGLTAGTQYNVFMGDPNNTCGNPPMAGCGYEPGLVVSTTGSGASTPTLTVAEIAAAAAKALEVAKAAKEAAAAAAIASARTTMFSTLSSGKPVTANDLSSSGFKVLNSKSLDKVNSAIAKFDFSDASVSQKINDVIEKINYTDTFFDPKDPATKDSLISYGISVTDSATKKINAEIAKGGITAYPDITALKTLVAKVNVIEKIASAANTNSLQAGDLLTAKLITPETQYKTTVLSGLRSAGTSITSVADLEAAIKAQEKIASDRFARTRAIVARIATTK